MNFFQAEAKYPIFSLRRIQIFQVREILLSVFSFYKKITADVKY